MKDNMKDKIVPIVGGALLIALGIIIAVCGAGYALDIFIGVIALIAGAALLGLGIYSTIKDNKFAFGYLFLGIALLLLGSFLLASFFISLAVFINIAIVLVLALGAALLAAGIFNIVKKNLLLGIIELVLGVALIIFASLYIALDDFRDIFWIIVGVVVAVFGVLVIVSAFVDKKGSKKK